MSRLASIGFRISVVIAVMCGLCQNLPAAEPTPLEQGFQQPPEQTRPWVYWYWISDNISKEGITRDLEAMARAGIGEALIGNIFLDDVPAGQIKVLSPEWWALVEHAIREGKRVGVNVGMFNCPGWSQSGGPWIGPEQAMRYLTSSQTRVTGPTKFEGKLPVPKEDFQDVAVLAFPAPAEDADTLAARSPQIICIPAAEGMENMVDGNLDTAMKITPDGGRPFTITLQLKEPMTARSLQMIPSESGWAARCELQAADKNGNFQTIKTFKFDRSNMGVGVGPMPRGPVAVAFEPVTARQFRLVLTEISGSAALAEIDLSGAARLESFVEKQLGKMHPTPLPMWDTYLWPSQPAVDQGELVVPADGVIDLTSKLATDGTLDWDMPAGDWVILRVGMVPTGTRNAPSSPEGQGREVDKMNRDLIKLHFDAFIGRVLDRMPAADRQAFKHVVADSYEQGSQNWTDGLETVFRERYGYDPLPWLPVLTGRIVGSAEQSDRFLWDLRRLVADRVATEYVGGLRDQCRPHGLELWLENYGHWGFPAEFLQYGGQSDRIGGEFWTTGTLGSIECRAASSAANTYGKPFVSAEAFTSAPSQYSTTPSDLKARGDWAFCEGVNHFVLHVYIQQPWEDKKPGVNAWFGTEFNRHNTWFEPASAWIGYLRRCCFLLQQGSRAADVAYFIGEDTPKMTGTRQPSLPAGYDFDYINGEVIREKLQVKDGCLVLPNGATYRVLVLPEQETMRPELLAKIAELVEQGAVVVGPPPQRSPSLQNYPQCDEQVRELAAKIWDDADTSVAGSRQVGKGRIVWGIDDLQPLLSELGVGPDFLSAEPLRYTHRVSSEADIYFVANPQDQAIVTPASFRAADRAPELWYPDSGRIERPAVYDQIGGTTRMPIALGPYGSVFVVFPRDEKPATNRIIRVTYDDKMLLDTTAEVENPTASPEAAAEMIDNFTLALWVKPSADTVILPEANAGVHGIQDARNDAIFPTHGGQWGDGHSGCGLAVGRNGIGVYEHAPNYFTPLLIYQTPVEDWTHVALVYRDAQPHLYINGEEIHTGLKSNFKVHPGAPGENFQGKRGDIKRFAQAMDIGQIKQLMQSMPRPDDFLLSDAVQLTRTGDGTIRARVFEPGDYVFRIADGTIWEIYLESIPGSQTITGPWRVRFDSPDLPDPLTMETLVDWTQHPSEAVRHYAGKATYRQTFTLPKEMIGEPFYLDLGEVHDLATIRLNGKQLGTLWIAPWRVEITDAVRPGENVLEVDVVNCWYNRLVGDAALPPEQRTTFLARPAVTAHAPLRSSGLIGPVTIRAAVDVEGK